MNREPLRLVLHYRDPGRIAFNVLLGALETDPATAGVPVDLVPRSAGLEPAIARALDRAERVLVGWSFFSAGFPAAAERLAQVRARINTPAALHVAGGVHASADPLGTLRAGFDLVAVGEGERTVRELVRTLLRDEDPRGVVGVAGRDDAGNPVLHGRGEFVDLNAYPPFAPAHDRLGPIEITRGCAYACKFCQTPFMNRARFRHRTIANVLGWVRVQHARGFRDYRFLSPTSLSYGADGEEPNLEAVDELLGGVRGVIGPAGRLFYGTFPSELRPEHVSARALAILKRWVDNRSLIIGGQSGAEPVLAASRRGHGVDAIRGAVALATEAGFVPHVDFIFGLPGEGPDEVDATLRLMEEVVANGALVHGHAFMPLPGTPFQNEAPGTLDARTQAALDRLAARGKLYGQWRTQMTIGRDLTERRKARAAESPAAGRSPRYSIDSTHEAR